MHFIIASKCKWSYIHYGFFSSTLFTLTSSTSKSGNMSIVTIDLPFGINRSEPVMLKTINWKFWAYSLRSSIFYVSIWLEVYPINHMTQWHLFFLNYLTTEFFEKANLNEKGGSFNWSTKSILMSKKAGLISAFITPESVLFSSLSVNNAYAIWRMRNVYYWQRKKGFVIFSRSLYGKTGLAILSGVVDPD